ncbi:MAG: PSP1 domain-containing protein [Patescibacteria group bacterium]
MKAALIKFSSWEKIQYYYPDDQLSLQQGDRVVAKLNDAEEMGYFVGYKEIKTQEQDEISDGLLRRADEKDMERLPSREEKEEALADCESFIAKRGLQMKLVDVHFSFDRTKITFAFSSEGRVDFRSLVRDLASHFNCIVRLYQIGKRDEAKVIGDCGSCGRPLCCREFINDFNSITSKMAEVQQVAHRGSERISGMCGRLKCCLEYEQEGYKKLAANLPSVGEKIKINGKKAEVTNCNVLKQTVGVKIENNNGGEYSEVELDEKTGRFKPMS